LPQPRSQKKEKKPQYVNGGWERNVRTPPLNLNNTLLTTKTYGGGHSINKTAGIYAPAHSPQDCRQQIELACLITYVGAHTCISVLHLGLAGGATERKGRQIQRSYQSSKVLNEGDGSMPSPSKAHQAPSLRDPSRIVAE